MSEMMHLFVAWVRQIHEIFHIAYTIHVSVGLEVVVHHPNNMSPFKKLILLHVDGTLFTEPLVQYLIPFLNDGRHGDSEFSIQRHESWLTRVGKRIEGYPFILNLVKPMHFAVIDVRTSRT